MIQRHARGWAARRRTRKLRQQRDEMLDFLAEQEHAHVLQTETTRRKEIERRMHPRTAADFEVLYNELEAWRLQETKKIKVQGKGDEEERRGMQDLLHKVRPAILVWPGLPDFVSGPCTV